MVNQWLGKPTAKDSYNGTLLSNKTEEIAHTYDHINESDSFV